MKRYPCQSRLLITCRRPKKGGELHVAVKLQHEFKHVLYFDVTMPPEANQMIEEQVEWLKPATMVSKIQSVYPQVTATQVHTAWRELSKAHWLRDKHQISSATKLLNEFGDDVDVFQLQDVPEGTEMVAWGMKKIAQLLKVASSKLALTPHVSSGIFNI